MKQLIDKANTVALEQKMVETIGLELDIFRLQSENLAEKIINLISFQHYFVSTVAKSLLLGFLGFIAFCVSLFTFGESLLAAIIFSIFGLIPFTFLGSIQGLVNFLNRLQDDIAAILTFSLEIVESILSEFQQKASNVTSNPPAVSQIISDLILFGIIPATGQIIRNRIPVLGGSIARLIDFVLNKMEVVLRTRAEGIISQSTHLENIDRQQQELVETTEEAISQYHQTSLNLLSAIKESSHNIIRKVFGSVTRPFRTWQIVAYLLVAGYIIIALIITN